MANMTLEERKKLRQESIDLVIKRSGVSKKTIIENAMVKFFNDNMDLLTAAEIRKYKNVVI